jgi:2-keto-3-deoxy-L-rhamnonate aldolase RhmA
MIEQALKLKARLAAGEFCPGVWLSVASPVTCEIIAGTGFDWILVDGEHHPLNPADLLQVLMAMKGSPAVCITRVPQNAEVPVKHALDMGWDGVLIPQVNTVEDARRAVSFCRYPPLGKRGYGPIRAGDYGRHEKEYVARANDALICAIQIENVVGAEQIEEIVRVPGIDWIMVGPNDMSASTDRYLDRSNPVLIAAIKKIFEVAQAAGIPTCTGGGSILDMQTVMEMGCQLVCLGRDVQFLREAADGALAGFRRLLDKTVTATRAER